ncbi:hypothetical protein RZS08_27020, partial [Arthrospira platensis SPKY1]|nr:hypothetical protein [Arthrospira platensis SPKY1]
MTPASRPRWARRFRRCPGCPRRTACLLDQPLLDRRHRRAQRRPAVVHQVVALRQRQRMRERFDQRTFGQLRFHQVRAG